MCSCINGVMHTLMRIRTYVFLYIFVYVRLRMYKLCKRIYICIYARTAFRGIIR